MFFIGIVLFGRCPRLHWDGWSHVTDQKTRAFIKTDDRIGGIIGLGIQIQDTFHGGQKGGSERADAPCLLPMRFQVVFFRMFPTLV